jgi:hypothetical protein
MIQLPIKVGVIAAQTGPLSFMGITDPKVVARAAHSLADAYNRGEDVLSAVGRLTSGHA